MVTYEPNYRFVEVEREAIEVIENALSESRTDQVLGLDRGDTKTQAAASDLLHRIAFGMGEDEIVVALHGFTQAPDTGEWVSGELVVIGKSRVVTIKFKESELSNTQMAERDLVFCGPDIKSRGKISQVRIDQLRYNEMRGIRYSDPEFAITFDSGDMWKLNADTVPRPEARMKALAAFLWELDDDEEV